MDSDQDSNARPPWFRGAVLSGIGVIIGAIAFVLFCYALGLNFQDEGWGENQDPWQSNRTALVASFLGFAVAILAFWIGFVQITRAKN